jgi:hypothetical protein
MPVPGDPFPEIGRTVRDSPEMLHQITLSQPIGGTQKRSPPLRDPVTRVPATASRPPARPPVAGSGEIGRTGIARRGTGF